MLLYLISSKGLCNSDKQSEHLPSSSSLPVVVIMKEQGVVFSWAGDASEYKSNVNMESYCNKSYTIMQDPTPPQPHLELGSGSRRFWMCS